MCWNSFLVMLQAVIFKFYEEINTFKVCFQKTYFENTFFPEKHVVATKMVWLNDGGF